MKVGTKSLLFGVHQFALHPLIVAVAWWKLYGFPFDPRLWIAFIVHDWGYWGCKEMDGPEGDNHVVAGAYIMHNLFDWPRITRGRRREDGRRGPRDMNYRWLHFCLGHSRYWAKKAGIRYSRLCIADKLSMTLYPKWLYFALGKASGEIYEYLANAQPGTKHQEIVRRGGGVKTMDEWFDECCAYLRDYCAKHRDCTKQDDWTKI